MKNEEKISTIIDDLRKVDPAITLPDAELSSLVSELIAAEPSPEIDEQFSKYLRAELVNPAHTRDTYKQSVRSPYLEFFKYVFDHSEKFVSAAAGALIALIIAIPGTYVVTSRFLTSNTPAQDSVKDLSSGLSLKQQINDKGTDAFGKLALLPETSTSTSPDQTTNPSTTSAPAVTTISTGQVAETTASTSAGNILQGQSYTYVGTPITLTSTTGVVFKREQGTNGNTQLGDFIKGLGLTNFSSFSNLDVEHIDLTEPQSAGYVISLNFSDGTITITAKDDGSNTPAATSSTMTDTDIIAATNSFLNNHSIDISSYGTPYITDKSTKNSTVTVLYPLELAGQDVYDTAGNRYGIEITVNTASQKVVLVQNLSSQVYESSNYGLVTDVNSILSPLTATSSVASTTQRQSESTTNLETPHNVLMRYVQTQSDGTTNELYVPALLFPIENNTANPVVIPLLNDTFGLSPNPTIYDASVIQSLENSTTTSQ